MTTAMLHPDLARYLAEAAWPADRQHRVVVGLRVLQQLARSGKPITYSAFAELVQPGLAAIATGRVLEDIGLFCNHAGWPNVTCFVVNKATGECSYGMDKVTKEDAEVLREAAWLEYASRKTGPLVDVP